MRYKAKTENRLFYDPSLTHKRGLEGKPDWLYMLPIYGIYCKAVKAIIKEISGKKKKSAIL